MVFLVMERSAENIAKKKKTDIEKCEKLRKNIEKLRERKTKNRGKSNNNNIRSYKKRKDSLETRAVLMEISMLC